MKPDLSLIIACYNEEPHLLRSVEEIEAVMSQTKYTYEFIFIDDCSKDKTKEVIKSICNAKPNSRYVFHTKNVGRGGTVKEGLLMANATYAGFLDIDLEVHARYIPSALLLLEQGYDVVTVDRIERFALGLHEIIRLFVSTIYSIIVHRLLSVGHPDTETGFKFFNLKTMRKVIWDTQNNGWFWDTEIIIRSEMANKKLASIKGVFARDKSKKSTVRVIPDSIAHLKAIRNFKKSFTKNHE